MLVVSFTFQSGTIQALLIDSLELIDKSLHSNLVQFKPEKNARGASGSESLHSNLVQFKPMILKDGPEYITSLHSNLVQFKLYKL